MSEQNHYRVLVVDDNPSIHEDFSKILTSPESDEEKLTAAEAILFDQNPTESKLAKFTLESAFQGAAAIHLVRNAKENGQPFALAFVDIRMPPGMDGIETIAELWKIDPTLQAVICTAYSDYSWNKITECLGISDSLVLLKKPFDNAEVLQLCHALTKKWLVTQQAQLRMDDLEAMVTKRTRQAEEANREAQISEERFSKAFHNSPIAKAIQTLPAQRFVDVNEAFLKMTGYERQEIIGRTPLDLRLCMNFETRFLAAIKNGEVIQEAEAQISTRRGDLRTALLSIQPLPIAGEPHALIVIQDISERLALENQLRQSQKMEAIGQLAAGIAHDFNNLLTIIQGHASLYIEGNKLPRNLISSFRQINDAAERAANLTKKLLAFSRRGMMRPKVLLLNETVKNLARILTRLLGEQVFLKTHLSHDTPRVFADPTSIEQVIMNLVINARDAMPGGGTITISTDRVFLSPKNDPDAQDAKTGTFAKLTVQDTGIGMDETTRDHIFEPFFTTKTLNKGTGMGLATVYGIIKQHDGWIELHTELNKGTTFHVYLPITEHEEDSAPSSPDLSTPSEKEYTIFVVEDDPSVRALVVEVLRNFNYKIIEAECGDEAIAKWPDIKDQVDLLLTDIMMPGKANGIQVASHCLSERPQIPVIYTSGYSSELFGSDIELLEGINYLPKPYLSGKLTQIVTQALLSSKQKNHGEK